MRIVLSLAALGLATAAAPSPRLPHTHDLMTPPPEAAVCSDRIEEVRASRGLPKLDRGDASREAPLLIAAVDRRIGGCSVMVMKNDTSDVRPLPKPKDQPRLRRVPDQ